MLQRLRLHWHGCLPKNPGLFLFPVPKMERLKENLGAQDIEFSAQELAEINKALSKINIAGERYPEEVEKLTGK